LDETVRAALGEVVAGVSARPGAVVVHLTDTATTVLRRQIKHGKLC